MDKIPFLITIPHGGQDTPPELKNMVALNNDDMLADGDAFTTDIYDIPEKYTACIKTNIARAFIDMNRPMDQLPPDFPDGIIKSMTCYKKSVYLPEKQPSPSLVSQLIRNYYLPFHQKIQKTIQQKNILIGLDCHSMAGTSPPISSKPGISRPKICLSNNFGKSCNHEIITLLSDCFKEVFLFKQNEVMINSPFSGGHIIQTYGNQPKPWIQIELNRCLYLDNHNPPILNTQKFFSLKERLNILFHLFNEKIK